MSLPTLEEFAEMCRKQDFTYWYTDDHKVYTKGKAVQDKLQTVVREGGRDYLDIMIKAMEKQGV